MKKVLLVLVVFGLLSVVTPVYASDIDGAYLMSVQSNSAILGIGMIRADAGTILVTYCDYTEAKMHMWLPLMGPPGTYRWYLPAKQMVICRNRLLQPFH